MRTALLRLDPTSGTFTTLHVSFLRLCLQARTYSEALPIIDKTIHSFPSPKPNKFDGDFPCSPHQDSSGYINVQSGFTERVQVRHVQEYYLMAGMIFIGAGRHRWKDAILYLEMVLLTPTEGPTTGYMLEAYKKWLLLNCLVNGRVRFTLH
jgi:COP9 signalosome complex subunit 3